MCCVSGISCNLASPVELDWNVSHGSLEQARRNEFDVGAARQC